MPDDVTTTAPEVPALVNIHEDCAVRYWIQKFGCTKEQLADAVTKVGVTALAVGAEMRKAKAQAVSRETLRLTDGALASRALSQ